MRFILPSLRLAAVATCSLAIASLGAESPAAGGAGWVKPTVEQVAPGVWKARFGTPERFTPGAIRETAPRTEELKHLPASAELPFELGQIRCRITPSHTAIYIPCDEPEEQIYGFGLDPGAYEQKGLRKYLTVCAGIIGKTSASHGPVPFYVSTRGYGIYVDTARVPLVHVARLKAKEHTESGDAHAPEVQTSARELDVAGPTGGRTEVVFELQGNSRGVEVYVFGGPTLREAVQRYNLFSGGGAVPPMWGLGLKYPAELPTCRAQASPLALELAWQRPERS